ncbi:hypothetical protein ATY81_26555 [Rhizobium sp. R72]|nr:hypothetical protein ATY81_26555 [Rhizobium sp. R72]OWV98958.1 hypothetical protein ATY80_26555 [Rhizobium sp. R711]
MSWRAPSSSTDRIGAAPQLDPEAVDAARAWYRDVYLAHEFRNSLKRVARFLIQVLESADL